MRFFEIFSTAKRQKILEHVLLKSDPSKPVGVDDTAKKLKLSKGLVSKCFEILASEGILRKYTRFYLDESNHMTRVLRTLLSLSLLDVQKAIDADPDFLEVVEGVGVYGSWSRGDNIAGSEVSDIELWIRVSKNPGEETINDAASIISENVPEGCGVSVIVFTPHRMRLMREKNPEFYSRLKHESVVLWGKWI